MWKNRDKVLLHLVFWVVNVSLTFYVWQLPYYVPQKHLIFVLEIFVGHSISILYFYMVYLWIIPDFFMKKRYISYILLMIAAMSFNILGCAYVWNSFEYIPGLFRPDQRVGIVFSCILYGGVATAMKIIDFWHQSEKERTLLEKALKEAELLYLQSQMSPHFLFNTLNNIYGLSLKNAPETGKAISHLKDIMLYFQQFEKGGRISIKDEIQKLRAFIALHQLRSHVIVDFVTHIHAHSQSLLLEPMLLLPSVENAFKHGDMHNPIKIILNIDEHQLAFEVQNRTHISKRKDTVGGIGLANVRRRLELLYPNKYTFLTYEKEGYFHLSLKLDL